MSHSKIAVLFLVFLIFRLDASAQSTQTIRGVVTDVDSKTPIIGANVVLIGSDPIKGAVTDVNGSFVIPGVTLGYHSIKVSSIGYEEVASTNLLVVAGKQLEVNFELKESITKLDEIVVLGGADKTELNNDLTTVSARTFNTEETSRYAGARNDVSRMAQNFAGVSNVNDARNDIVIRGNSPAGLLWRLDGVDIPSPNHFSSFGSTGGPVSMLNNNVLTKSDFMTAAFPANYGNAVSGVFDLQMRNGNNLKREYVGQVGFNGFELGAEGPLQKGKQASYLINYRYSTLGVFSKLGINFGTGAAVPQYSDLNFKVNLPTANAGRFTLFGVGGTSNVSFLGSETDFSNRNADLYGSENEDLYNKSQVGVIGLSHTYHFGKNTYYKLTLANAGMKTQVDIDSLTWTSAPEPSLISSYPWYNQELRQYNQTAHALVNHKFNAKDNLTAGVIATRYSINFGDSVVALDASRNPFWRPIKKGSGKTSLLQAYASWQHRFNDRLTVNTGVHVVRAELGDATGVEPRLGWKYFISPKSSLNLGVGVHHQMQPLPVYFNQTRNGQLNSNYELGFTRSQHLALGYDRNLGQHARVKLETYYQKLDNVPVERTASSFSMINSGAGFALPSNTDLVNAGDGRNYGAELTVERFYSQKFYALFTTSVFKSEYRGSDRVWRSTAYDGGYVVNLLGGKEWNLGSKDKTLGVNVKSTMAGGRRYTPIDLVQSRAKGQIVYTEDEAYSKQYQDYFRTDLKISYRVSKGRITQEWALDIQNVTNAKNLYQEVYNRRTGEIVRQNQIGIYPIPQYRILF